MNKRSTGLCPLTGEGLISEQGKGAERWPEDYTLATRGNPGSPHGCAEGGWERGARLGALGFVALSLLSGVRCQGVKLTSEMRTLSGG